MFLNIFLKTVDKLIINEIDFLFEIENDDLLFKIVQNKFEFTLFIDFVLHVTIQFSVQT
jgi:hypothetical protein